MAPELHLLTDGGFVGLDPASQPATSALLAASMRERPGAAAMAAAIDGSVALGADRVIVLGADEGLLQAREVAGAIEHARGAGADLVALAMRVNERPGILGYLLPALGRADRLLEAGRASARRWLAGDEASPTA
jgi:hypothetical protein